MQNGTQAGEEQESLPARTIELERGRELHEDRSEVVAIVQHTGDFQETF